MKKKIQAFNFLCFFALFSLLPLQAFSNDKYPNVKTLRTEIINLIEKPDLTLIDNAKETVNLSFLVNSNNEVVVIDADTESEYLENYIKDQLNYQLIKTDYVQKHKIYHIKLIFKKR